jgi:3-phenylpropionate/trans-cinnamate dioxygenase ferredoxin reductase component
MTERETNIIIGAGQAGAWAAVAMRQAGFAGRILLIGAEPWRPYERPPLSKAVLTEPQEPEPQYFHAAAKYADERIELLLGTPAESIDAATRTVSLRDGRRLHYNRLLLTTGGRARVLPVAGGERALLLRTLEDAREIRARLGAGRRVICIGAGVIGLEIASSAKARGAEVTVLETAPLPMGRCVSPEGARFMAALHAACGVTLRCNEMVEGLAPVRGGGVRALCRGGDAVEGDFAVAGVGMARNLALAEAAGLAIEGGIVVNGFGRTSVPGIYAAGDVAAFPHPLYPGRLLRLESWRHAQNHGIAVGRAMAGDERAPYDDVPWFWSDQHGVNLQVSGLPAEAAHTVVRVEAERAFTAVHLASDGTVVGVTAANAPRDARAGMALVKARARPDPAKLADPSIPMQRLLA